jgi:hypothetical protein
MAKVQQKQLTLELYLVSKNINRYGSGHLLSTLTDIK